MKKWIHIIIIWLSSFHRIHWPGSPVASRIRGSISKCISTTSSYSPLPTESHLSCKQPNQTNMTRWNDLRNSGNSWLDQMIVFLRPKSYSLFIRASHGPSHLLVWKPVRVHHMIRIEIICWLDWFYRGRSLFLSLLLPVLLQTGSCTAHPLHAWHRFRGKEEDDDGASSEWKATVCLRGRTRRARRGGAVQSAEETCKERRRRPLLMLMMMVMQLITESLLHWFICWDQQSFSPSSKRRNSSSSAETKHSAWKPVLC